MRMEIFELIDDCESADRSKGKLEYWSSFAKKYSGFRGFLRMYFTFEGIRYSNEAEREEEELFNALIESARRVEAELVEKLKCCQIPDTVKKVMPSHIFSVSSCFYLI